MTASTGTNSNLTGTGAISALARKHVEHRATHNNCSGEQTIIINLLNQALTAEMACVFRYRRDHFIARDAQATDLAGEFLLDANEKLEHAHKISERIIQLGGTPASNQEPFVSVRPTEYIAGRSTVEMITANLAAECTSIDQCLDFIQRVDDKDSITSDMLKEILVEDEVQAGALAHLLTLLAGVGLHSSRPIYTQ